MLGGVATRDIHRRYGELMAASASSSDDCFQRILRTDAA